MSTQQVKSCTNPKCEQVNPQPITEFYKNKGTKDGYNSHCKSCFRRYYGANREKGKEYYQANRQKLIEQNRKNYLANMEQRKEGQRRWEKENREYLTARRRERRRELPESRLPEYHRRRARKLGNGGSFTAEEWEALCAFYDYRCLCCKEQEPLTVDHVIPISKGGSSDISNLQPLCQSCNSSKRDKTIDYRLDFIPN